MQEIKLLTEADVERIAKSVFAHLNGKKEKPAFVSVKQFAAEYGISKMTIYRHIRGGHLKLHKFGARAFLNRADVERLFIKTVPVTPPQFKDAR